MAFSNNMTILLEKVERRLGVRNMNLPDELGKDAWVKIIEQDSLSTFSRYFPHKFRIDLDGSDICPTDRTAYIIDEEKIPGDMSIIGIKDIGWKHLLNNNRASSLQYGVYGAYDGYNITSFEDFAMTQMAADSASLFNNGIYLEFEPPNKVRLEGAISQNLGNSLGTFPIEVLLKHPLNLQTIHPTKMETFERLVRDDIAVFLHGELKFYDDLPTIFGGNVELHLEKIEEAASDREQVIDILETSYVSAANTNQALIIST